ncbi:MAG: type I glyceraldehyde-3-phosphate dehydrogenase [Candidatus Pelagibacter sp. TMED118]|nr:MAG: type I glyceraldehyde-3-phosphate dehydrogenase [Candidatus Pelagibacter sp. TMED118]|tara:strand:+ start:7167 stop:8162 length:996 start_codon:yes stop_codon:yes gene_type:complete
MKKKIGINGLGRIGRMIIRSIFENNYKTIKIKHINSRSNIETACNLIKYDSIHGLFRSKIRHDKNFIYINNMKILYTQKSKIDEIQWKKSSSDIVLECTGKFNSKEKLIPHLINGAKKVLVSAPCKDSDKMIVFGVNHNQIKSNDKIISAGSCTTNCLAPIVSVLHKKFSLKSAFMTTIHSYTSDQRLLDNSHKDPRRGRSAAQSIVPTSTGASKSIGDIIPELKGKLAGIAMRVPTPNVSLIELVFNSKKTITSKIINNILENSSKKELKGIMRVCSEKLVSIDFNHDRHSAIIDLSLTNVIGKKMGKVTAWYDNEWGFSNRMCDLVKYI